MSTKILITGICGFVGFHTAIALRKKGYSVVGIDNFNPYYSVSLKRERERLLKEIEVEIHEIDICEEKKLLALFEKNEFSHLLHLGAQAGVRYSQENPSAYVHSNLDGFVSVLEVC